MYVVIKIGDIYTTEYQNNLVGYSTNEEAEEVASFLNAEKFRTVDPLASHSYALQGNKRKVNSTSNNSITKNWRLRK